MYFILKYVIRIEEDINEEFTDCFDSFRDLMIAYQHYEKDSDLVFISVFIVKDLEQIL